MRFFNYQGNTDDNEADDDEGKLEREIEAAMNNRNAGTAVGGSRKNNNLLVDMKVSGPISHRL